MSDALEVTLLKLETMANGEVKLIFAVQKDDAHKTQHLLGKVGHAFGMALARINYQASGQVSVPTDPADVTQEAPTGVTSSLDLPAEHHTLGGHSTASSERTTDTRTTPEAELKQSPGTNRLAKRIGMLCNDIRFQKFLVTILGPRDGDLPLREWTADRIRKACKVTSRSEILPGTDAEVKWNWIESAYLAETRI